MQRSLPPHMQAFLGGSSGEAMGMGSKMYNLSPWVQSGILHVARPISQVPMVISRGEVDLDAADELAKFWQRPAKGPGRSMTLSKVDAIEATVGWLLLQGAFFWVLDDTWLKRGIPRSPILIARPDRMTPILDQGELIGWRFRDASGSQHDLLTDQVVWSRMWNPLDDIAGAAPAVAAAMAAESDYSAARYWRSLSESNGDLGETIIAPQGVTPEQREQIKAVLRRKRQMAARGKYEPLFLVGDIKTEAPHIQSPDAAAVTQRLANRHEVYIALGVPPSFAEVTASYSIGSASDRYRLIEETCMPVSAKIAEACEAVCDMYVHGVRDNTHSVAFDWDEHSTMQQVRSERMDAARKLHERGMPWDVVSDYMQLKLPTFPGSGVGYMPFSVQEIGGLPDPEPEPKRQADPLDQLASLIRSAPAPASRCGCGCGAKSAGSNNRWKAEQAKREPYYRKARKGYERVMFEARSETLRKLATAFAGIESDAEKSRALTRNGVFQFLFDLDQFLGALVDAMFKVSIPAYQTGGEDMMVETGNTAEDFIMPPDPRGMEWLAQRENHIKDAGEKVWTEIRDELSEGLTKGETYDQLEKRVKETFSGVTKEGARRIAVTEVSVSFETGRFNALVDAGIEYKEWITSDDDKVRDTHVSKNLKVIPIDEPFDVGGYAMMYPCDPSGPAKEVINCRCIIGAADAPAPLDGDIVGNDPTQDIPF